MIDKGLAIDETLLFYDERGWRATWISGMTLFPAKTDQRINELLCSEGRQLGPILWTCVLERGVCDKKYTTNIFHVLNFDELESNPDRVQFCHFPRSSKWSFKSSFWNRFCHFLQFLVTISLWLESLSLRMFVKISNAPSLDMGVPLV